MSSSRRLVPVLVLTVILGALAVAPAADAKPRGFKFGVTAADVTPHSAIFWARTTKPGRTYIQIVRNGKLGGCRPNRLPKGRGTEAAAGHSLGEYSALACAGVLRFEDAPRLVRRRGELMAGVNARTPGAMAAVMELAPERVDEVCRAVREAGAGVVEAANYNTQEQTVISGERGAVEQASVAAKEAGGGARHPAPGRRSLPL